MAFDIDKPADYEYAKTRLKKELSIDPFPLHTEDFINI